MTTTTNTWDEIDDVRLQEVSTALQDQQASWVTIIDGEVLFDTLAAAIIAVRAVDSVSDGAAYCNSSCHKDTFESIKRFVDEFESSSHSPHCSCREEILEDFDDYSEDWETETEAAGDEGRLPQSPE
jgi:hypothetical protein